MKTNDIDRRFESSPLFQLRRLWGSNCVLPFPLSIVDCYFIHQAFAIHFNGNREIALERISLLGKHRDNTTIHDVFGFYSEIRDAEKAETLFIEHETEVSIYMDKQKRFVLVEGPDSFLNHAMPYPDGVEFSRYVQYMLHLEHTAYPISPEKMYSALKRDRPVKR